MKPAMTAARPATAAVIEASNRNCPAILHEFFSFSIATTYAAPAPVARSFASLSLLSRTVGTLLVAFAMVPQCTVRLPYGRAAIVTEKDPCRPSTARSTRTMPAIKSAMGS